MNSKKVDIVMAKLASGIYRPWYWANYKEFSKQEALRGQWVNVVDRLSYQQIRRGLDDWELKFGVDTPPTPGSFAMFLKPTHSSASVAGFDSIRRTLGLG